MFCFLTYTCNIFVNDKDNSLVFFNGCKQLRFLTNCQMKRWQFAKWTIVTDIKGYDNKTVSDETVKST